MISLVRVTAENQARYLGKIIEIETLSYPTPWSASGFVQEVKNPAARLWAAVTGRKSVGFICYWLLDFEVSLLNLAVHPEDREKGVGGFLLCHMLEEAALRRMEAVWLEVRVSNAAAMGLYRKFGFEKVGVRPKYYDAPQEDAIVMRLHPQGPLRTAQSLAQGEQG
jgi:ribosomal-protein-alanine N-acetyltransferase